MKNKKILDLEKQKEVLKVKMSSIDKKILDEKSKKEKEILNKLLKKHDVSDVWDLEEKVDIL